LASFEVDERDPVTLTTLARPVPFHGCQLFLIRVAVERTVERVYSVAVPTVVAFMDDLLFLSRIREAAKGSSVELRTARKVNQLVAAAAGSQLILVDLDSTRLPTAEGLAALQADPALAGVPLVGFFSHVHAERAQAARVAGVTRVLARSAFVQELPQLLREASGPPPA